MQLYKSELNIQEQDNTNLKQTRFKSGEILKIVFKSV